MVSLRQF